MNTPSQSLESCTPCTPYPHPNPKWLHFSNQMLSRYKQSVEVSKKCKLAPSFDELGFALENRDRLHLWLIMTAIKSWAVHRWPNSIDSDTQLWRNTYCRRVPAQIISGPCETHYTWYFDSFSFTGGSKADIHWSHAPFLSICQIKYWCKYINTIQSYLCPTFFFSL